MCKDRTDFLQDVINRLTAVFATTAPDTVDRVAALRRVEADVRHTYGNERISIRLGNAARDAAIRRDWAQDVPYATLETRYGLTKRQLIRIAKHKSG